MVRRKSSVLTQSASGKKTVQFRIDPTVDDALKTLIGRIAKEAPGWKFDGNKIVEEALKEGIESANEQLDELKKGGGNGADSKPATAANSRGIAE